MAVWDDPAELGRRLAGARAYFDENQDDFGKRIGRSGRTVRKIELGEVASIGRTASDRRQLVQRVVDSGAPPEWFDLEEATAPRVKVRVAELDAVVRMLAEHLDVQDEAELARASADVDQLFGSSSQTSEGSDLGAENG